jgi:hypothetical protein
MLNGFPSFIPDIVICIQFRLLFVFVEFALHKSFLLEVPVPVVLSREHRMFPSAARAFHREEFAPRKKSAEAQQEAAVRTCPAHAEK